MFVFKSAECVHPLCDLAWKLYKAQYTENKKYHYFILMFFLSQSSLIGYAEITLQRVVTRMKQLLWSFDLPVQEIKPNLQHLWGFHNTNL